MLPATLLGAGGTGATWKAGLAAPLRSEDYDRRRRDWGDLTGTDGPFFASALLRDPDVRGLLFDAPHGA